MTRDEIRAWIERRLQALNDHDLYELASFYAEDCTIESPSVGKTAVGSRAAIDIDRAWVTGFPDVKFTTGTLLIDGDRCAWLGTAAGSDRGGFMGVPPTDRPFSIPMFLFSTLRDGLVASERRVYDFTGLLMQIGVLKSRPNMPPAGAVPSTAAPIDGDAAPGDLRAIVGAHAEAFARRDIDALVALHAPDAVMDSNVAGRVSGRDAIRDVYRRWFTALPDSGFHPEDFIIDGSIAAEIAIMTGTDTGGFLGFSATGRPVRVRSAWMFGARGGELTYVHPIYDFTGMLVQMGVIRPRPA